MTEGYILGVESMAHTGLKVVKADRNRFVSGSSGTNGALCIRGSRQDYDDWGVQGWSGDEVFKYMSKVW